MYARSVVGGKYVGSEVESEVHRSEDEWSTYVK